MAISGMASEVFWITRRELLTGLAAVSVGTVSPAAAADQLIVFAAISLKNAMDAIVTEWRQQGGGGIAVSFASSPALVRQLAQGAPAHAFASADVDWMDYATANGLIRADTRFNLAGSQLVLVEPKGVGASVELKPGVSLPRYLGNGRLAVADVNSVPAGKYAKSALQALGVWDDVKNRLAQTENTRATLLLVARGEVLLGIVYRSDAVAEPRVTVVSKISAALHPKIVYPVALTMLEHPRAFEFIAFLKTSKTQSLLQRHGFDTLE